MPSCRDKIMSISPVWFCFTAICYPTSCIHLSDLKTFLQYSLRELNMNTFYRGRMIENLQMGILLSIFKLPANLGCNFWEWLHLSRERSLMFCLLYIPALPVGSLESGLLSFPLWKVSSNLHKPFNTKGGGEEVKGSEAE